MAGRLRDRRRRDARIPTLMLSRTSARNAPQPLPEKIASLLQEARWLLLGVLALYVALILAGYDKGDPGWSHASIVERIANPGGRFGAWAADLLLALFGLSGWWCVAYLVISVLWGYRRVNRIFVADRRPFWIALGGFVLLIVASSGTEALRFHSMMRPLPFGAGGMIGQEVARLVGRAFGFTDRKSVV